MGPDWVRGSGFGSVSGFGFWYGNVWVRVSLWLGDGFSFRIRVGESLRVWCLVFGVGVQDRVSCAGSGLAGPGLLGFRIEVDVRARVGVVRVRVCWGP